MFDKDLIAIDINKESISILVGTKYKIVSANTIETPIGSFDNGNILDVKALASVIAPYVKKAKTKNVSFVVRGGDLITRHLNIPQAKDDALRDSVDFELRQFMGDRVDDYYFDFQIMNQTKGDALAKCDVLVVAASREKIDAYMDLAKELRLNVKVIDMYANAVGRVFADIKKSLVKGVKTVGIIGQDGDDSYIAIMEWGKLILEKYSDGGILQAENKEYSGLQNLNDLYDKVDLIEPKQPGEESDIDLYFKGEVAQYNSFVQYYTSGKVRKNLDRIYVIGSATRIKGIEQYYEVNLNARSGKAPNFTDLKTSCKAVKKIKLKDYIPCYGLLLRRE